MERIKYLVVHCSDTDNDICLGASAIHAFHADYFDLQGIGYHGIIQRNGLYEAGRPVYWHGAHTDGHDHHSLGVCLVGRDNFTRTQFLTLETVIRQWLRLFPSAQVVGHCDLDATKTCPNFNVKQWAATRQLMPPIKRKKS